MLFARFLSSLSVLMSMHDVMMKPIDKRSWHLLINFRFAIHETSSFTSTYRNTCPGRDFRRRCPSSCRGSKRLSPCACYQFPSSLLLVAPTIEGLNANQLSKAEKFSASTQQKHEESKPSVSPLPKCSIHRIRIYHAQRLSDSEEASMSGAGKKLRLGRSQRLSKYLEVGDLFQSHPKRKSKRSLEFIQSMNLREAQVAFFCHTTITMSLAEGCRCRILGKIVPKGTRKAPEAAEVEKP